MTRAPSLIAKSSALASVQLAQAALAEPGAPYQQDLMPSSALSGATP